MSAHLLETCICGEKRADGEVLFGIPTLKCINCGVVRQLVHMTGAEVSEWYRTEYMAKAYTHNFGHDYTVAKKRLRAYNLNARGNRLLDVGCGNGAFIKAAREHGLDAIGQDLSRDYESEHVYVGALEDVAFPTESFDVITLHDVLEHHPAPHLLLQEVRRLLKRPGKLIIDFPRFWHTSGKHHWKQVEHLWMFTEEQLRGLLGKAGFDVTAVTHPIESKIVLEAQRRPEQRLQILVPPGIGDSLWSITKLPGFLKEKGLGMPDVWVQDSGGPRRTEPFLRNIPWLYAAGYKQLSDRSEIFREAYMQDGRTVFENVADCDYFIAYNGIMRYGKSLEETDPQWGCEWRPKMHVSKTALKMKERLQGQGPYILTYWAEAGMYREWLADFSAAQIAQALKALQDDLGVRIVFMGASWDRGQVGREIAQMNGDWQDLIGETTFDQMLGAIMGASAVVGFPAGNTILATVTKTPTVLLWNRYFHRKFWTYACPQDAPYSQVDTLGLTAPKLVAEVKALLERSA